MSLKNKGSLITDNTGKVAIKIVIYKKSDVDFAVEQLKEKIITKWKIVGKLNEEHYCKKECLTDCEEKSIYNTNENDYYRFIKWIEEEFE